MRRLAVASIPLAVAAVLLALWLGGGSGERTASTRLARSTFCPKLFFTPPPGMQLVDRRLRDLGGGLMGESRLYRAKRAVEVHVGYEALEAQEDLDFEPRGVLVLGGSRFELSRARAINYPLWAATFDLGRGPAPCRKATIIAHGFAEQPFRTLLATMKPA